MIPLGHRKSNWQVSTEHVRISRQPQLPLEVTFSAQPQSLTIDLHHTAVIVVDMQNDFCSAGGWVDYIGGDYAVLQQPIDPINTLLHTLRPLDVPIIWLNWGNRPDRLNLSPSILHVYNGDGQGIGIGEPLPLNQSHVLEKGSWSASIIEQLQVEPTDIHVDKYRMSGFWDTPLDSILRNLDINTILFTGVNLDQCVMATLQDAVNSGYDSILLEDCCATNSPTYCKEGALYNIRQCYGFTTDSEHIVQSIKSQQINQQIKF